MNLMEKSELAMQAAKMLSHKSHLATAKEKAFKKEKAAIETRLRRQEDQLAEKTHTTETNLSEGLEVASKAWCLSFTSLLVRKLPVELRRMILDHLFVVLRPHHALELVTYHKSDPNVAGICKSDCVRACDNSHLGIYFLGDKTWVDVTFAAETAAALYRTTLVRLQTYSGGYVPQISCILDEDVLGTRCIPRDHITKIEVEIPSDQILFLLRRRIDGHLRNIFVDSLRPLLSIKNLKEVHIVLNMLSGMNYALFSQVDDCLTPVTQGFIAMGVRRVLWFSKTSHSEECHMMEILARDDTKLLKR